MFSRFGLAAALALVPALFIACPSANGREPARVIIESLNQEIELAFDGEVPLKAFFELLMKKMKGRDGREIPIIVFKRAFEEETKDAANPEEALIAFPAVPKRMAVATALRLALDQVPGRNATYLIRCGTIEITTHRQAAPRALLDYPVTGHFDMRPLQEVMEELSELSGASIIVDARLREKALMPVSATFKNTIALKTAVTMLAEMADLHAQVRDDALFITNKLKVGDAK